MPTLWGQLLVVYGALRDPAQLERIHCWHRTAAMGAILTAGSLITGLWWLSTMLEPPALAIAWAALLAGLVGYHFHKALQVWRGELEPEPLPPGPFEAPE